MDTEKLNLSKKIKMICGDVLHNERDISTIIKSMKKNPIKTMKLRKHSKHDDECYLDIKLSNGDKFCLIADYGSYTGNSIDEYCTFFSVNKYGYED